MASPARLAEASCGHAPGAGRARLHRQERLSGELLGLSGGIDSALVLAIAVDALGADKVRAVMMPSPYTADISWIDARDMSERLGVRYDEISIKPEFEAFRRRSPRSSRAARRHDEENIQARIRGVLLMALSNKFGGIVLTTATRARWPRATARCMATWPAVSR
jgi:NAD+ synthase (glutamine-hydrolysing)